MIKIALVSPMLNTMGGGAKDLALIWKGFDRSIFDPIIVSSYIHPQWPETYGIDTEKCFHVDIHNDPVMLFEVLKACDVVILWVGTSNEPSEYERVWEVARRAGVKLKVFRIVFGLGIATPDKADLFLTSSMDSFLAGTPCRGCHVVYPPLPTHPPSRQALRDRYGILKTEFVVGYACADQRAEFFSVAQKIKDEKAGGIVFLSALDQLNDQQQPHYPAVPKNIKFCGILPQNDMPMLYDACDVMLHTRTESFGYSVYQGLAAGIPMIALWTDSRNAFAEAMYPYGGYLARNVDGLVDALHAVIQSPLEANERATRASLRVMRLHPTVSVRRIEQLVLGALEDRGLCPLELRGFSPKIEGYVTERDIEIWKIHKDMIEQKLKVQSFI